MPPNATAAVGADASDDPIGISTKARIHVWPLIGFLAGVAVNVAAIITASLICRAVKTAGSLIDSGAQAHREQADNHAHI